MQDNIIEDDEDDIDMSVIGPKSKKQEMFLSSEADITVFGGR